VKVKETVHEFSAQKHDYVAVAMRIYRREDGVLWPLKTWLKLWSSNCLHGWGTRKREVHVLAKLRFGRLSLQPMNAV
jgi:hypothetical protein